VSERCEIPSKSKLAAQNNEQPNRNIPDECSFKPTPGVHIDGMPTLNDAVDFRRNEEE
jgi:hypothetical protein